MLWHRRWANASCSLLVFWCANLLVGATAYGQTPTRAAREIRAAVDVGWVMGISAPDFFRDYQLLLGGTASGFDVPTSASVNISTFMLSDAPFGLACGYYKSVVRETYTYEPNNYPQPTGPRQSVTQNIELSVIPAMVTFDYFPFQRQFTGYVGIGAGIGATHFFWEEVISASNDLGARLSGVRYDEWSIVPALAVRAGISLGFDKRLAQRARAGIYIETGYLWVPVSGPFFEATGETLATEVPRTTQNYDIQAGGVTIKLGFSLLLTGS